MAGMRMGKGSGGRGGCGCESCFDVVSVWTVGVVGLILDSVKLANDVTFKRYV
jgi:hypothetical protein